MRKINFNLKALLTLVLVGSLTVSCDKYDQEEVMPIMEDTESSKAVPLSFALSPNFIFEEDFEGTKPFSTAHAIETGASHSLTYVSNPGGSGKAARFELRDNDPIVKGNRRAEVTIVKDNVQKDMWYGFEAYLPSNGYVDEADDEVINQWYQSGMGSPPLMIRVKSGKFEFRHRGSTSAKYTIINLGTASKNVWHKFVVHINHSAGKDGIIELWLNGKKLVNFSGATIYSGELPKWKIGIYKDTWGSNKTTTNKRVLYFDNIRVGNSNAKYENFASGTGSTGNTGSGSNDNDDDTNTGGSTGDNNTGNNNDNITPSGDAVVSFTLVNSRTNKDIMTIANGAKINLRTLGIKAVNIRANTNPSSVGNVQMVLTGPNGKVRVDDELPYALFGDTNGQYHSWGPSAGSYTLSATPHSGTKSKSGPASGPTLKINFTITR